MTRGVTAAVFINHPETNPEHTVPHVELHELTVLKIPTSLSPTKTAGLRQRRKGAMASSSQGVVPQASSNLPISPPPPAQSEAWTKPSPGTVQFETGNPSAGAVVRGSLSLGGNWDECSTVCVEGVPGIMTSADFCVFLRPQMHNVEHLRLLRPTSERNKYMVATRLKPGASSSAFAAALTGRPYLQGLVAETCRVRPVLSHTFHGESTGEAKFPWRKMFAEPVEHCITPDSVTDSELNVHEADSANSRVVTFSDGDNTDHSCAVCLEPLHGNGSLVTTLCNHTLHAACLAKCELNRCPVCRHAHELTPEASVCMSCSDGDDVWMCVVCAYVGCGMYRNKHAYTHFRDTHHPFAMNLNELVFWSGERVPASSVWDYISERFVDRLLTSEDGKVVELGPGVGGAASSSAPRKSCSAPDVAPATTDFENEAAFAAAITASQIEHAISVERAKHERERMELTARAESAEKEVTAARRARAEATRERKAAVKRADAAEKEAAALSKDNAFLKNLNETLLRDQEAWRKRVDALAGVARHARSERDELKEQLRDLMMHLETQKSISAASSSAQGSEPCRAGAAAAELAGGDVLRVGLNARERLAVELKRRSHR